MSYAHNLCICNELSVGKRVVTGTIAEHTAGAGVRVAGLLVQDGTVATTGIVASGTVTTNTINENTAGAGVTVDGLTIRDSAISGLPVLVCFTGVIPEPFAGGANAVEFSHFGTSLDPTGSGNPVAPGVVLPFASTMVAITAAYVHRKKAMELDAAEFVRISVGRATTINGVKDSTNYTLVSAPDLIEWDNVTHDGTYPTETVTGLSLSYSAGQMFMIRSEEVGNVKNTSADIAVSAWFLVNTP